MRYQGGKSRIASHITAAIAATATDREIWEPFCGGCAVTQALARAGFTVHASDSHPDLILMWQAIARMDLGVTDDVSEGEYRVLLSRLKSDPPSARRGFVGFGASFGGRWFEGFGRDHKNGDGHQPFQEAQRSIEKFRSVIGRVTFALADYRETPDDAMAYCDIPYAGTKKYNRGEVFNHAAFWEWAEKRTGHTFVSEVSCPLGWPVVWEKSHRTQMSSNSPTTAGASETQRTERLFYRARRERPYVL